MEIDFEFNILGTEQEYWDALRKDKKNIDSDLTCILTRGFGQMFKHRVPIDENFKSIVLEYSNKLIGKDHDVN